jgi:uncharacterized protein (TIGR00251 family)
MGSMDGPVTRLRLRVSPGAGRSTVVGRHGDGWKVRVAAAPERGRANDELVGLLSSTLGVARGRVQLVSGATGRDKVVELSGVAPEEIDRRLEAAGRKE